MDVVHHALIGGAGYLVASEQGEPIVGLAFLIGSVFPDLDVIFMALGKRFYLRHHQEISHAVPLAPIYAVLCVLPFWIGIGPDWQTWLAALSGIVLHIILDLTNTFRVALLLPFSRRRWSLDAIFFIDAVALALTALFYLGYGVLGFAATVWIYPALFVIYVIAKLILQRRVKNALGCAFAIPSALNPFSYFILESSASGQRAYRYNALTRRRSEVSDLPDPPAPWAAWAARSPVYEDLKEITRAYRVISVDHEIDRVILHAGDLAVRNFGGKFAKAELTFDRQGRLIDEKAAI